MAVNDVVFNRNEGGLGRPLPGNDHLSGMLFYTAGSLPSGFTANDRVKKIFSVRDAENLGILDDHADETLGTGGLVLIASTWIAGEVTTISIDGGVLGTFTVVTGSVTVADVVAGLVAAVNAGTSTGIKHGWVAVDTASTTVTLTQPAKLGVVNNTGTPIVFTTTSVAGTGTPTQFTSGVGSYFAVMHYHISEFFRNQPKGVLWVGIYAQATYDGTEVETIQNFTSGQIRQLGIYLSHEVFASSQLTATQDNLDTLETQHRPMSVVFHSDLSSATLSALADLTTLSNERVSMLIGEEGDYHQPAYSNTLPYLPGVKVIFQGKSYISKAITTGNSPWDATKWTELRENLQAISGFSIGTMGATLGTTSFVKVNENIGWVAKTNLVSGTGLDEVAFATTDLWEDVTVALKDTLNTFHYIYLRKIDGISGTFHSDSFTAIIGTSDFATIENVRTMDKAVRNIRTSMLPNLSGPLFVNADGTLTEDTLSLFKNDSEKPLTIMLTDAELSAFIVTIDSAQNVLGTSKVVIAGVLVPVGVARQIEFNIGFDVTTTS